MKYFTLQRYDAGDHVAVYPTNSPELVEKLGSLLNVDLDAVISLNNTDGEEVINKSHYYLIVNYDNYLIRSCCLLRS